MRPELILHRFPKNGAAARFVETTEGQVDEALRKEETPIIVGTWSANWVYVVAPWLTLLEPNHDMCWKAPNVSFEHLKRLKAKVVLATWAC